MKKDFYAFGTQNQIYTEETISEKFMDQLIKTAYELDDRLSVFKQESDVTRINRNAGIKKVEVNKKTIDLLSKALSYSKQSDGAFDITIRPAVRAWSIGQKEQKVPEDKELKKLKELVNYQLIHINERNRTVFLEKEGQAIDLGGIAKGHAADRIKQMLVEEGISSGMLNFGGSISTIGKKKDGTSWRVGIQNPLAERGVSIGSVTLNDQSMVTSAINERFFIEEGILHHHLLDPTTLRPSESGVFGVTAIGESATDLDALTTALFVMGVKKGIAMLNQMKINAVFLLQDGGMYATNGFTQKSINFTKAAV